MRALTEHSCNGSYPLPNPCSISIAKDFSETPYGRYREDGPESGEVFREEHLLPALKRGSVELDIDGLDGLPSSFWEEALGGLVRRGLKIDEIRNKLSIVCTDPELATFVRTGWRFIDDAASKDLKN